MNKLHVAVVTFPTGEIKGGHLLVERLLRVIEPLTDKIYAITGNYPVNCIFSDKIEVKVVTHKPQVLALLKSLNYIKTQFIIALELLKIIKKVDLVIFFIGGALLPSILTAKIFGRKTIIITTGSAKESAKYIYKNNKIFSVILSFLETVDYSVVDKLIVYSPNLIDYLGIRRYEKKISVAHEHYIAFDKFKVCIQLVNRDNLIGYIGRFSEEKGIRNFVKSIPIILKFRNNVNFVMCGDGPLKMEISDMLKGLNFSAKVQMTGWVAHDELPRYLNQLKLVVLPSYTEGLPNILLEAMACGTPVLTTAVGAIPDIITDGVTGFIMEDNSPSCISKNIMRALNHSDLDGIANSALALVRKEFALEKAIEGYKKILNV